MLVRGVVMQNPGLGLGFGSINFRGQEFLWVAVVATLVLAMLSMLRVSVVSVGWTWGSKPGHVCVRVQSFSSLSDIRIFDEEILSRTSDSCSKDASSSSDEQSKTAEMVFIFGKTSPLIHHPRPQPSTVRIAPEMTIRSRRTSSQDFEKSRVYHLALLSNSQPNDAETSESSRREGIRRDAFPTVYGVDSLLPVWMQPISRPLVCTDTPSPTTAVKNTVFSHEWDPLWKLRVRDAVVRGAKKSSSVSEFWSSPLTPVSTKGSSLVTLRDDVVRIWDSETKCLVKSLHLSKGCGGANMVTGFDADLVSKVAAVSRKNGTFSIVNLEVSTEEKCCETNQSVQAIHLDRGTLPKTIFTGGPAVATPGYSVSLWDSRSSSRQLSMNLNLASTVYGIRLQGPELYVNDEVGSLSAYDVRMLGATSLNRVACDLKQDISPDDRWWDIDTALEGEEEDVDDEFWDCQTADDDVKVAGGSYVGSLVMAMSRNFTTKVSST